MSTRKVVINRCFGGFSLSPRAVARLAELQGRPCFFFTKGWREADRYVSMTPEEAAGAFVWHAFDIPDPNVLEGATSWHEMTMEECAAQNALYAKHAHDNRPEKRDDPLLVQVVEELGDAANGPHAELAIVDIPADVEFTIEEYDGREHVAEAHRTWR